MNNEKENDEKKEIQAIVTAGRRNAQHIMNQILVPAKTPKEIENGISLGEYTAISIIAGIAFMVQNRQLGYESVDGYLSSLMELIRAELVEVNLNLKTNAPTGRKRADTWN